MKFQNQFNRNSSRLKDYDYSNGIFFITICTSDKKNFFGEISDNEMHLSKEGQIIESIWNMVSISFDYAESGVFVVMPNHFHAIVSINGKNQHEINFNIYSSPIKGGFAGSKNPMFNENLSTIVRWFKGKCTYDIRKFNKNFSWQSRFHENIIRDEISFQNIENYILNNPLNWDSDSLK